MHTSGKPIAVVQGAQSVAIQQLLSEFCAHRQASVRIAGVVEEPRRAQDADGQTGMPGHLRSLGGAGNFPIFQDLGPGSTGCSLDGGSLVQAGEWVRRDMAAGCDLVVLSKFGKFEAENGSGLLPAFGAAIELGVPILTSVAPKFMAAWDEFAAPYYLLVPPDRRAIEDWWDMISADSLAAGERCCN